MEVLMVYVAAKHFFRRKGAYIGQAYDIEGFKPYSKLCSWLGDIHFTAREDGYLIYSTNGGKIVKIRA